MLCFQRAGLNLERDIAAAYEARKQARLLQATKPSDRETRTAFRHAAEKFLHCSKIATSKQQTSCYLRAADCLVQAEEWKPAAQTFIKAGDFGMAAKCFRNGGYFSEAVETVQAHPGDIQENVAEDIIKVARLEYLRTAQYEQAEELFDDLDEQLECMEDFGLESGRIEVLEQHQRHEEAAEAAAEAAFNKGDLLEGIRLLHASNDPKLLRKAVEKALGGLWVLYPLRHQIDPQSMDDPAADELIQYLSNGRGTLTEEEMHQFEVFEVIRAGDLSRVGSLAQSHGILASDSPLRSTLSLLCFPRNSNSLIPSKEWTLQDLINTSKLTWKYISQLFLFVRTLDMSDLPTQKLLGVEPAEYKSNEDTVSPGFRIYSTSLLFDRLQQQDTSGQGVLTLNPVLGLTSSVASESDSQALALNALYSMLQSEISKIHEAASHEFQALYPCLDFSVFGNCKRADCRRQQVNSLRASEVELQVLFNQRTRALIMQVFIVHKYHTNNRSDESERRRIRRTWAHKMYETLMPLFSPLGGPHCVDGALIPELDKGADLISVWCHQALIELDPHYGAEERFLSDTLTYLDLAFRVDGTSFAGYAGALHSSRLKKARRDLMTMRPRSPYDRSSHSIMHDFINFYRRKSDDIIRRVIHAIHHVVVNKLTIEANVLVNLLEFIGREIIVHHRTRYRGKYGVFDGLVVPQSWGLDMAKRPPLIAQAGVELPELVEYLSTLYKTLENLRNFDSQSSRLYSFSGKGALNVLGRGVLILRICRLVVLVANNTNFTGPMKEDARVNISGSLTGPGDIHRSLCDRLVHSSYWGDLERTIIHCPLNRGTDRLVHLFLRKGPSNPPPRSNNFIQVIAYSRVPELNQLLSFTGSIQLLQPTLNPQAQPFNPLQPSQSSSADQSTVEPDKILEPERDAADLMRSNHESAHFGALPENHSDLMRSLTTEEIESGRKILYAYRQYALQKENRQRSAVEIICRCYSRYLRRRNACHSAADERYFKFQREYKKGIEGPEAFENNSEFYRYKAILLGCMPHVAAHLRGLEHANQLKKHANRKRLQTAHHRELEEIQARMDACGRFAIELKELVPTIMPGSKELDDLAALRTHVKSLQNIYREMVEKLGGDRITASLEQHHRWGVAIILAKV
ncbi:unnamed protein product [Rhizoctonia solani]|uniref:Uncharacterized protein n=1 Tax=Rhizoctonia solani TaxID=456999 RepID=A0A8H3E3B0_9AGAM|nr:unnamed protein product [Rhizoctonia solani]